MEYKVYINTKIFNLLPGHTAIRHYWDIEGLKDKLCYEWYLPPKEGEATGPSLNIYTALDNEILGISGRGAMTQEDFQNTLGSFLGGLFE